MEFVHWFLLLGQILLFFPLNGHYCIAAGHGFNIRVNQKKIPMTTLHRPQDLTTLQLCH